MADNDQVDDDQQSDGGALRRQLEAALAENKTLKEENTGYKRRDAFSEAGIDISQGPGKLLAEKYDGELEADAIKAIAAEYGIEPASAPDPTQDRQSQVVQTQQRADVLRSQSASDGVGKKLSMSEFFALNARDTAAARQAFDAGQVDVPPHVAEQLAANASGN
jgi:hypothetical protein